MGIPFTDLADKGSHDDPDTRPTPARRRSHRNSNPSVSHKRQESGLTLGGNAEPEKTTGEDVAEGEAGGLIRQVWAGLTGVDQDAEHLGGHHRGTNDVRKHWAEVYEKNKNGEEVRPMHTHAQSRRATHGTGCAPAHPPGTQNDLWTHSLSVSPIYLPPFEPPSLSGQGRVRRAAAPHLIRRHARPETRVLPQRRIAVRCS